MPTAGLRNVLDTLRTAASLPETLGQTDAQLLERYVAVRDEVAFEALVRRHGPMVLGVCRRIAADPCDAEDAFQATFLVLARKAASVVPPEKVTSFLYGVACRAAQKARAATARRRAREKQVRTLPEPATVAEGLWHDLVPILDQELRCLPDKYRLPLVLCDLEGRTRSEAAGQLCWPEGTVAGRLARGRTLLARRLARHGLPVSGGVLTALLAQEAASAGVPGALVGSASRAAAAFAGGPAAAAGSVSANVAFLTGEVLQAMLRGKLKVVIAGVLLTTVGVGLAGGLAHRAWAGRPTGLGESAATAEPPQDKGQAGEKKPEEDAAARELKALQGDWKVVGLAEDGRKPATAEEMKGMRWTFKGSRLYGCDPRTKSTDMGEVRLDPGKNPKHIDLVGTEGANKGKTLLGIYKREQGRLIICLRDPGKERPTEFTADAGSDQGMITLESLRDPPKAPARPEPPPEKPQADASQGRRWAARGPDALQVVGPAGPVGLPVKLPRYRLQPGQELVYTGETRSSGEKGSASRSRSEMREWVVRANQDGSWRLVSRATTITPARQELVSLDCYDLFPDGRMVERDSPDLSMHAFAQLMRLPADAAEAVRGWATTEEGEGRTYRYRLLPPAGAGRCALEAVCESPLDAACGVTIKMVETWDPERGLPETMQAEATYADKRSDRSTVKLTDVKTHDAAWCRQVAADADRYFAADAAYRRTLVRLARQGGAPAEVKTALEKAVADLKVARGGLEQAEFRQRLDELLAEHEIQAQYIIQEAERRATLLGRPAADWSTTDLDGKPHALKDYHGKVVVLDFWYRQCYWCVRAMPQVKEIAAGFKGRPVVVLGMNTDAREEDARVVVEKMGLNYATLKAAGLPEQYKVQTFPTLIVIDQEGVVRDVHVGYSPTLREDVVRSVERLLKAKP
jgi:RNA polymerase sigma-70 factor (ECF subfamily)